MCRCINENKKQYRKQTVEYCLNHTGDRIECNFFRKMNKGNRSNDIQENEYHFIENKIRTGSENSGCKFLLGQEADMKNQKKNKG